jgi:5-methylcytosine-specific restriction endonuclease McrA
MRTDPRIPPENEADAACRICGDITDLTFEHLPPRSAGNRQKIELLDIAAWLRREDHGTTERGRISQKGAGANTLCEECNNHAGRLYVPEFRRWIRVGNAALAELKPAQVDAQVEPAYVELEIEGVRPGRFMKQVVTMLLAQSMGGVAKKHADLREYARDPQVVGLPSRYQIYLAFNAGPNARYNGGSVAMRPSGLVFAVELSFPPFTYILSIDEEGPAIETGNITNFADLGIDQTATAKVQLRLGFSHTPLPLDLRSKAALEQDRSRNEADAA